MEEDIDTLERFFKAIFREREEEGPHHPIVVTALVYDCLRRGYYQAIVPVELMDYRGEIRTWIGRKLHETEIMPVHELKLEWQGVHGRVDGYDPEAGKVLEVKTCRRIPSDIRSHHLEQLKFYRVLLERNGFPVRAASVLYIDVSSAEARAYKADVTSEPLEDIERRMLAKAELLRECLLKHELPPRQMNWLCKDYCPYFSWCFADYNPPIPDEVLAMLEEPVGVDEEKVKLWLEAPNISYRIDVDGDQLFATIGFGSLIYELRVGEKVSVCSCGRNPCEHMLLAVTKAWLDGTINTDLYNRLRESIIGGGKRG